MSDIEGGIEVELWRVPTPLANPVLTPAGPYDTFFHVVVAVSDGEHEGWCYSALATDPILDDAVAAAATILDGHAGTLGALLRVEELPVEGDRTAWHAATSAIALAAWDLVGRRLGMPCADLWGRRPGTEALDAYASGFFLDASGDALVAEATRAREAGFRFVKMRAGLDVDADLARFDAVRTVFPEPGTVAVDAVCSWPVAAARDFAARVPDRLLWLEDATPYAELPALRSVDGRFPVPVAAGESVQTLPELEQLRSACALDVVLLDVQQLGGPLRFLAAAHALALQGARITSHIYTGPSAHLLACVDDPLPVEVFDWSDLLMDPPPAPRADGRVPVEGAGLGVTLRRATLDTYGTRIR